MSSSHSVWGQVSVHVIFAFSLGPGQCSCHHHLQSGDRSMFMSSSPSVWGQVSVHVIVTLWSQVSVHVIITFSLGTGQCSCHHHLQSGDRSMFVSSSPSVWGQVSVHVIITFSLGTGQCSCHRHAVEPGQCSCHHHLQSGDRSVFMSSSPSVWGQVNVHVIITFSLGTGQCSCHRHAVEPGQCSCHHHDVGTGQCSCHHHGVGTGQCSCLSSRLVSLMVLCHHTCHQVSVHSFSNSPVQLRREKQNINKLSYKCKTETKGTGYQAFSVQAPLVWNNFPAHIGEIRQFSLSVKHFS